MWSLFPWLVVYLCFQCHMSGQKMEQQLLKPTTYHRNHHTGFFFFFKEVTALLHSDSGHLPPTLYAEFKEPPSHLPQFSLSWVIRWFHSQAMPLPAPAGMDLSDLVQPSQRGQGHKSSCWAALWLLSLHPCPISSYRKAKNSVCCHFPGFLVFRVKKSS